MLSRGFDQFDCQLSNDFRVVWRRGSPPHHAPAASVWVRGCFEKSTFMCIFWVSSSVQARHCSLQSGADARAHARADGTAMARKINRLNARAVATIEGNGRHADGGGLYLSISSNGGRRWVFLFRWHGKPTEIGF